MRGAAALALVLGLTAAAPAPVERFAISCSGVGTNTIRMSGSADQISETRLKDVIFVIDEDRRMVERMGAKDGKFAEVCSAELDCTRDFTAGRIRITGGRTVTSTSDPAAQIRRTASFDWDRTTNRVETVNDIVSSRSVSLLIRASLTCKPAKIPATYVPKA